MKKQIFSEGILMMFKARNSYGNTTFLPKGFFLVVLMVIQEIKPLKEFLLDKNLYPNFFTRFFNGATYSEPCHISEMELFEKIINVKQPLTILAKSCILDVSKGSEDAMKLPLMTSQHFLSIEKWFKSFFDQVYFNCIVSGDEQFKQEQPRRGVRKKRCSENMQKI